MAQAYVRQIIDKGHTHLFLKYPGEVLRSQMYLCRYLLQTQRLGIIGADMVQIQTHCLGAGLRGPCLAAAKGCQFQHRTAYIRGGNTDRQSGAHLFRIFRIQPQRDSLRV